MDESNGLATGISSPSRVATLACAARRSVAPPTDVLGQIASPPVRGLPPTDAFWRTTMYTKTRLVRDKPGLLKNWGCGAFIVAQLFFHFACWSIQANRFILLPSVFNRRGSICQLPKRKVRSDRSPSDSRAVDLIGFAEIGQLWKPEA